MEPQQKQRVLVYCLSGLGDAILASPALAALAAEPDRFALTLLTMFPSVTEYLQDQQLTADVRFEHFLGMSKVAILRRVWPLRQERFDVSVVPYAMNRLGYNFLSRVVGARRRIGFRYQRQGLINLPQLNQCVLDEMPEQHAVEENLRWAALLTGRAAGELPDDLRYETGPAARAAATEFLLDQRLEAAAPLIGLHAGCNSLKNQQRRCWSPVNFAALIERLGAELPGARFLLFQGPQDLEINRQIIAHVQRGAANLVVARQLPMRVVGALIRRCQLFVSNDSGLMHTAAACQVPGVALFGPTNPAWVRPWKTPAIVVSRHLPCSPCFYYSSRPLRCPAHLDFACLREIPLEQVAAAAGELLARTAPKPVAIS